MESEVEIRKDIKRHLRECITENEKLALKINHLKYSNMMLRKERDLLLERLAKTNTDVISSDSEAETEMKSKVFGKSNGFSGLSIKSTPKSKQSGSAQHTPTDFREPKKKLRRAHYVACDASGSPILPVDIGVFKLLSLGTVCTKLGYHSEKYIYPVGYSASREYQSYISNSTTTLYTSSILDGGEQPKFQIIAADDPDNPIVANTTSGAWSIVVKKVATIREKSAHAISGPEYFGLTNPTIMSLLQALPDVDKLVGYRQETFQTVEVKKPRKRKASVDDLTNEPVDLEISHGSLVDIGV